MVNGAPNSGKRPWHRAEWVAGSLPLGCTGSYCSGREQRKRGQVGGVVGARFNACSDSWREGDRTPPHDDRSRGARELALPFSSRLQKVGKPRGPADARNNCGPLPAGGIELPGKFGTDAEAENKPMSGIDRSTRGPKGGPPDQERSGEVVHRDASWRGTGGRTAGTKPGAEPAHHRRDQAGAVR